MFYHINIALIKVNFVDISGLTFSGSSYDFFASNPYPSIILPSLSSNLQPTIPASPDFVSIICLSNVLSSSA